jgi:glycosyltransferase involved in cell wall biosynthesis
MYVQPFAMAIAAARAARQIARAGFVPDVVDAHYFYPDGIAAALVARRLRKPLVITARGSDVNLLGQIAWPRRLIRWAAGQAQCIVTVSAALAETLHSLGVDGNKISVVRNGVDADRFAPVDRAQARQRLGLADDVPLIVSIGNLVPEKGHDLVIDALVHVPDARLLVVGDGPQRDRLLRRIDAQRLGSRAMLLPAMAQQELCWIYGAADVVALASIREGLPNVLLEALACGTRVVAMRVGGVPEIVTEPVAGRLVEDRSAVAFARSLCDILGSRPTAAQTRAFAARFDWSATARGHVAALERAIALHAHRVRDARPATAGRDA